MSKPKLLDLFCCAGGAARGYADAGFDVYGVDIREQRNYPFAMVQEDALFVLDVLLAGQKVAFTSRDGGVVRLGLHDFAAIHASPPCQRYSDLAKRNGNADDHPDLVDPIRRLLIASGKPYIIENVEGAPLIKPVVLCGTMFPGLRVKRHRLFESSAPLTPPCPCPKKHPLNYTMDKRKAHYGKLDEMTAFVQVTGGGNCSKAAAADAMGIDWMTKEELNEAIPPAYTAHLGRQLLAHLQLREAA